MQLVHWLNWWNTIGTINAHVAICSCGLTYKSTETALSAPHARQSKDIPENSHGNSCHPQSVDCAAKCTDGKALQWAFKVFYHLTLHSDSIPSNCSLNICRSLMLDFFLFQKGWHVLTFQRIQCVCRTLVSCPWCQYSAPLQQLSASPQICQCWQPAFCTWAPASAERETWQEMRGELERLLYVLRC